MNVHSTWTKVICEKKNRLEVIDLLNEQIYLELSEHNLECGGPKCN